MESMDQVWLFVAIALAAGAVLGALLHKMFSSSTGDADKLRAELENARSEMERYKASVNSHFSKTSDLVSELTQDYVKVYKHLAEGEQTLSDSPEFTQMLEQSEGRVLISVEDDIAEQEAVVAEQEAVVIEPEAVVVEPFTDAIEAMPVDEVRLRGDDAEVAQHSDSETIVAAGDDPGVAEDDRKDPVIGDSNQDAENDPSMTPAAQKIDMVQEDSTADSARRV